MRPNGRWTDLCCCSRSLRPTCGSCACKLSAAARWSARSSSAAYEPRIPRSHYAHASSCERSGPSADVGRDVALPTRWPQRTSPSERRMIRCLVRQVRMRMWPLILQCGGVSPGLPGPGEDVAGESPGPDADVAGARLSPFTARARSRCRCIAEPFPRRDLLRGNLRGSGSAPSAVPEPRLPVLFLRLSVPLL